MSMPMVDAAVTTTQVAQPAPLWHGVTTIVLHCQDTRAELCRQLAEQARRDAPIRIATIGETATDETEILATLRVSATFGETDSALSLTLAADRPVAMDDAQGSLLPRRFVAAVGEGTTQFLDRVLDVFLPWRGRRGPGRIIQLPKGETLK